MNFGNFRIEYEGLGSYKAAGGFLIQRDGQVIDRYGTWGMG